MAGEVVRKRTTRKKAPAAEVEVFDPAYEAHRLRVQGLSWREVAGLTGYPNDHAARAGVTAYLTRAAAELNKEQQSERLAVELDRLDALQAAWWHRAIGTARDADGLPLLDEKAANVVLNVIRTRSKLLGLETRDAEAAVTKTVVIAGSTEEYVAGLRRIVEGDD